MRQLLTTLINTVRARFITLVTKLQILLRPNFWQTLFTTKIREFLIKIFDVKPRHKKDYYPFLRWLVSRRLVIALVLCGGVLSLYLLWMNMPSLRGNEGDPQQVRTYRYNALALKFYKGNVNILAKDGYTAYTGMVQGGTAKGVGSLFTKSGALLYEGQFDDSMFNGTGKLNYPDGTICYEGDFVNNLFSGKGSKYRANGVIEYQGDFLNGSYNGIGTLFNSGGNPVCKGTFARDRLVYSEFVGKKTGEVAEMYSGISVIYSSTGEYCVDMDEIEAVYTVKDGSDTLEAEWVVEGVCVLDEVFPTAEKDLAGMDDLIAYFGTPSYYGNTYLRLGEAVAANKLAQHSRNLGRVEMATTPVFEDSITVDDYDRNFKVYIYTFEKDGLMYTFYCKSATSDFLMYAVTKA